MRKHLEQFGIDEDLAMGKIKRMSGGQKSRLVLAAAMWINPHIIALDEPTNYLDNDTLAALTKALSDFKGGVLTISHNKAFVNELCNETWNVGDGVVETVAIDGKSAGGSKAGPAGHCSPHRSMSLISRDEGSECASMTWRVICACPYGHLRPPPIPPYITAASENC